MKKGSFASLNTYPINQTKLAGSTHKKGRKNIKQINFSRHEVVERRLSEAFKMEN